MDGGCRRKGEDLQGCGLSEVKPSQLSLINTKGLDERQGQEEVSGK